MKPTYGIPTFVRIPPPLRQTIDQQAESEGRTVSAQIVYLLKRALAENGNGNKKGASKKLAAPRMS